MIIIHNIINIKYMNIIINRRSSLNKHIINFLQVLINKTKYVCIIYATKCHKSPHNNTSAILY